MGSISLSILATLLLATANASDRIDQIVAATTGGPVWLNGIYPIVDLPVSMPMEDVVANVMSKWGWTPKGIKFKIDEIKLVHIPGGRSDVYTAVLLKTDVGDRVLLLQKYGNASGRWWSRILAPPA